MKKILKQSLKIFKYVLIISSLSVILAFIIHMISQSRMLTLISIQLSRKNNLVSEYKNFEENEILEKLLSKVKIYEQNIQQFHLLDGLVVNKTSSQEIIDVCDSLLFSSLRYVALNKLGMEEEANNAWNAIEKTSENGEWFRHPRCKIRTSRDMIEGLLISLSQMPPRYKSHIESFLQHIKDNHGFFHDEIRSSVSFLTPGMAEFLSRLIHAMGLKNVDTSMLKYGFSTMEFSSLFARPGYEQHLIALDLWLSLEIDELLIKNELKLQAPKSVTWEIGNNLKLFTAENIFYQKNRWVAWKIYHQNTSNLFFKWLFLKYNDALSKEKIYELMDELLTNHAFPESRLPMNCDRKADYLWQRKTEEHINKKDECTLHFAGVDFLWMAAILYDDLKKNY